MKRNRIFNRTILLFLSMLMILSVLSGCAEKEVVNPQTDTAYKAGTYVVEADGIGGPVKVEVTFSDGEIEDIEILSHSETAGLGDTALDTMKERILSGQSLTVDTVSGATVSSEAILVAVEKAVKEAGGDVEALKNKIVKKEGEGKTEKLEADVIVVGAGAS